VLKSSVIDAAISSTALEMLSADCATSRASW
jgi:hypothetical protein